MNSAPPTVESLFVCPVCGPRDANRKAERRAIPAGFTIVICTVCGIEWQWPRPTPDDLARLYTQEYFDAWGIQEDEEAVRAIKMSTFSRLFDDIERHTQIGPVLDVGCATGYLLEAAERRGWQPFGIELSEYGSSVAKKKFGDTSVFHGRLEETTFQNESFAAITMTDLIEHVLDPVDTLQIAYRLLRPGGVLCITTPRVGGLSYHLMRSKWTQYKLEHLQYFSPESLAPLLARAGLSLIEAKTWPKTVTLNYVRTQFARYRHSLISPAVEFSTRVVPAKLRSRPIALPLGDMLALARRE
jgi:2-polyprenyl-3-methyl-5-hydroxy-6-metoxy-1,4-benzoquinol methylase